jgi:hypothetical protein
MCSAQNEPASDCCIHVERNAIVSNINMRHHRCLQPGTRAPSFRLRVSQHCGQCIIMCTMTNTRMARSIASFSAITQLNSYLCRVQHRLLSLHLPKLGVELICRENCKPRRSIPSHVCSSTLSSHYPTPTNPKSSSRNFMHACIVLNLSALN